MRKAYKWVHPMNYAGRYPDSWAGYTFLQWSDMSKNWHEGVDYNGPGGCDSDTGMAIFTVANGTVDWWGYHNGWGWHLYIKHEDPELGEIYSHYAHCLKDSLKVKVGDEVRVGEKVAEVGDSGWNDMCAHIHFEIRKPIGKGYDFWANPAEGWDQEKMKEYYYDPFLFIEERKNREEPEEDSGTSSSDVIKELEGIIEKQTEELKSLESKYEEDVERYVKEISSKNNHVQAIQKTLSEVNAQLMTNSQVITRLTSENAELRKRLDASDETLQNMLDDKNKALMVCKEKRQDLEKKLDKIKKEGEVKKEMLENNQKYWYRSKTLWVNFLALAVILIQRHYNYTVDMETQFLILSLLNVVLRAITKEEIVWSLEEFRK